MRQNSLSYAFSTWVENTIEANNDAPNLGLKLGLV